MDDKQKIIIGVTAGVSALIIGIVLLEYYLKGNSNPGNGSNPCTALGTTPCSSNSDCSECESCIDGCCQTQIPSSIIQINIKDYKQCVTVVNTVLAGCLSNTYDFSTCGAPFQCGGNSQNANVFTGYLQVIDSSGNGVPCQKLLLTNDDPGNSTLVVNGEDTQTAVVTTDSTGTVSFNFKMTNPSSGGSCPEICTSKDGKYLMQVNAQLEGTSIVLPFDWTINVVTYA